MTLATENDFIRWEYNCLDIDYTYEIDEILSDLLSQESEELQKFYEFQINEVAPAIVNLMNRGVKVDLDKKQELLTSLSNLLVKIESDIVTLLGFEINLKSSLQIKRLFKDFLGVKPIVSRKSKTESFGSDAMLVYLEEYPLLRPFISLLLEYRSVGVFVRTFLSAQVDTDNRMRTAYNVAGTKTYRLSSRKNAFGKGMNLQNVPSKGKIDLKYSLIDLDFDTDSDVEDIPLDTIEVVSNSNIQLPNCKELFICEEDEMFFDIDLAAADARVIAWLSECKFLTELFEDPNGDIYLTLAKEYYKRPNLSKKDKERQIFKAVAHATNYLGRPTTISAKAGLLVHEVEQVQKFYFDICPEIPRLHKDIERQVKNIGYLTNCWGARGWFLDKRDPMLMNKAMAWAGSSPVGILINKGLVNIEREEKDIKVLLQVHDSLSGVFKKTDITAPDRIIKHCSVALPFDIPRIIPVNIKTSDKSYGNCE